MRIGKPLRKSRAWKKAGVNGTPKYVSPESVVGRINSDIISSVLAPKIAALASASLERYAGELLVYEDIMKKVNSNESIDGLLESDSSIIIQDGIPQQPQRPVFHSQFSVDEAASIFSETSEHFFAKAGKWKAHANAAKFERILDEKYGILRPFITNHPEIEHFIRGVQRKYAMGYFSPFRQGDPPIPRSTAVIILFMMQRGQMRWEIILLTTLFFLIGLQPWALVVVVGVLQGLLMRRKAKPLGKMKRFIPAVESYYTDAKTDTEKHELLLHPVGEPLPSKEEIDASLFDALILGSGPASLYIASLLSRAGRKVLVLSSRNDASGCLSIKHAEYSNVPFDVEASNVAKISRQQQILAPALCTETDTQGGVRFAQIGSNEDAHAFEILSIPGMGTDSYDEELPFILNADGGTAGLIDDAAKYLNDGWPDAEGGNGNSVTGAYAAACEAINSTANEFYISKILSEKVNSLRSSPTYQDSGIRYAQSFLNKTFTINPHTRSLMAGIGMKGENIRPGATSMAAHVTNISAALSGEGMHYPIGGPRALCRALANVVLRSGGRVLTSVDVAELIFGEPQEQASKGKQKEGDNDGPPPPRCVGVKLSDGREIKFASDRFDEKNGSCLPAVISMEGFIWTFINMLPDDIRMKYKVPRGLPALSSRRPVFKVLFALKGSADQLNVTGADYYRLPNAAVARDEFDQSSGQIKHGEIGWSDSDTGDNGDAYADGGKNLMDVINQDPGSISDEHIVNSSRKRARKTKFEAGSSWLHVSFPSAKDPSFEERHGKTTTCVVTIEADDDFVTYFDTKPKIYVIKNASATKGDLDRLLERVKKDVYHIFPQLRDKVDHCEICGPFQKGLSHNPERFAAKGIRADTPYPGLFVGGSDLTVGESFSGDIVGAWLAANAVEQYGPLDHLFLQKNITTDIEQFLEEPGWVDEEDVAIPYKSADAKKDKDV
jgi:phytoene dehydrogenase-like protein